MLLLLLLLLLECGDEFSALLSYSCDAAADAGITFRPSLLSSSMKFESPSKSLLPSFYSASFRSFLLYPGNASPCLCLPPSLLHCRCRRRASSSHGEGSRLFGDHLPPASPGLCCCCCSSISCPHHYVPHFASLVSSPSACMHAGLRLNFAVRLHLMICDASN